MAPRLATVLLLATALSGAAKAEAPSAPASAARPPPVVLVHYHKSGNALTNALKYVLPTFKGWNLELGLGSIGHPKRTPFVCSDAATIKSGHLYKITAPFWNVCAPNQTFPSDTKVVHFVRDPYSMATSSYLYHRQDPTPEHWVNEDFDTSILCLPGNSTAAMAQSLGMDLRPISRACATLVNATGNFKYYSVLTALDDIDGLRLETSRFIASPHHSAGADLVTMPYNANWLRRSRLDTIDVYMDDWNADMPREFGRLLRHVFGGGAVTTESLALLNNNKFHPGPHSHHTTSVDAATKAVWARTLRNDPALGPALEIARRTLAGAR